MDRPHSSSVPPYDIKVQGPDHLTPSSNKRQTPNMLHALGHGDSSSSQKSEELANDLNKNKKLQNESCAIHSEDLNFGPCEETVSFKTINDRIVKVCERRGHSPKGLRGQTVSVEPSNRKLSLTTEVMQLLNSNSSDSSAEEDTKSHKSQCPTPSNASKLNYNEQNLYSSDEDYASDAPSETDDCPLDKTAVPRHFTAQLSSSSGSDKSSDSELQCLRSTEKDKGDASRSILPEYKRVEQSNGVSRLPCTSHVLTKIFPQIKFEREAKAKIENRGRAFNTQHSTNGEEVNLVRYIFWVTLYFNGPLKIIYKCSNAPLGRGFTRWI